MWHVEFFQKFDLPGQLKARTILRGVESDEAARETSTRLQALLRSNDDQASAELIRVLASCTPGTPCSSAACPVCDLGIRVKFVANASRRIARDKAAGWSILSIVPPRLGFRMNQLHQFDPSQLKEQVRRQIEASELSGAPAVGSIGFAVQVIERRFFWRPYLELVVRGSWDQISKVLAKHYKPSQSTPRPVYVRILDKAALLTNAVSNTDPEQIELGADQWREIVPLLDQWGLGSRLICQNWRVADCARSSCGIAKPQERDSVASRGAKLLKGPMSEAQGDGIAIRNASSKTILKDTPTLLSIDYPKPGDNYDGSGMR
jgi:hypothetical protein